MSDPECDCTGVYKWWISPKTSLSVKGEIGPEGWAAVRSVATRISTVGASDIFVDSGNAEMAQGRREDVEAIWKVASTWTVHFGEESSSFCKTGMSEQEWMKRLRLLLD